MKISIHCDFCHRKMSSRSYHPDDGDIFTDTRPHICDACYERFDPKGAAVLKEAMKKEFLAILDQPMSLPMLVQLERMAKAGRLMLVATGTKVEDLKGVLKDSQLAVESEAPTELAEPNAAWSGTIAPTNAIETLGTGFFREIAAALPKLLQKQNPAAAEIAQLTKALADATKADLPHIAVQIETKLQRLLAEDEPKALPEATFGPNDGEMCPNCVTPWKCNGPHIPTTHPAPVPTVTMTVPAGL